MDMRKIFLGWIGSCITLFAFAQQECRTFEYGQQLIQKNTLLQTQREKAEEFVSQQSTRISSDAARMIIIPVVVHVLYHYPAENISDDLVKSQITALNRDFSKQNADTVKIPAVFKALAADCGIQFQLATVDPKGRATTGIVHKYTPITKWTMDDQIKASSEMGDDGWDPKSYLNVWVGSLDQFLGYSSMPADPIDKDGVVISYTAFGIRSSGIYRQGRTAVHETGHWLGLRHLWGDEDCGDDGVDDTPQQATFTNGCPSSVRISCNNGPSGDMYMDYMDFTNDDCLVMFTRGQKQKMRALFEPGGTRNSILSSQGLGDPLIEEIPLPDAPPQWLRVKIYPDPAGSELTLNVEFDTRWVGKELKVINISGQTEMRQMISAKIQKLDISRLKPGLYFIKAEKDGDKIIEKFVKL